MVALGRQVVHPGLQRVEVDVAGRFHHQLEAAGVAEAPHRRRPEGEHARLRDLPLQAPAEMGQDGLAGERGVPPFVERLEDDEHVAVVRAVGVQDERQPRDGHRVGYSGRIEGNLFDRLGHLDRALQRGGIGQLDVHHQVALVLDGDESAGHAGEAEACQTDQPDVDEKHDDAEAEAPTHGFAVDLRRPLEEPVEAAEEMVQCPVYLADQKPAQRPSGDRARKEKNEVDSPG